MRRTIGVALGLSLALMVVGCAPAPVYYTGPRFEGSPLTQDICKGSTPADAVMRVTVLEIADGAPVELRFEVYTASTVYLDETHLLGVGDWTNLPPPPVDCYTLKVSNVSPGREGVTVRIKQWYPYVPSYWG